MRTLVIIPALNEEASLPAVLQDLHTHVPDADVLVVDDGSTDSTARVARVAGARVARLPINLGIGAALRVGFRYAADQGYDRAVQFDADGQHDASEIAKLFTCLDAGADFAIGTRFAEGSGAYDVGATRGFAMRILRAIVRIVSHSKLSDTSSGFRGFARPTIELFARTYPREYMDSVEAIIIASRAGLTIDETAVQMHERTAGTPSNRSFRLVYNYLRVLAVLLLTIPIRRRARAASRRVAA